MKFGEIPTGKGKVRGPRDRRLKSSIRRPVVQVFNRSSVRLACGHVVRYHGRDFKWGRCGVCAKDGVTR